MSRCISDSYYTFSEVEGLEEQVADMTISDKVHTSQYNCYFHDVDIIFTTASL